MAVSSPFEAIAWESWQGLDPAATSMVRWKLIFSHGYTPTKGMSMGLAEISAHGVLPLHCHAPAEVYHVLAGEGCCEIEGVLHELSPGISLFIPPDALHRTTNTGARPLAFLFMFPSDSFDQIRYRFHE